MSVYYDVYGTVTMPVEVFEKEKNAILGSIMQWAPDSDAENVFSVIDVNSKTKAIIFDYEEDYTGNTYRNIGEYLIMGFGALKNKYPDQVKGEVLLISTDGMYYAAKLDMDGDKVVLYTLQPHEAK